MSSYTPLYIANTASGLVKARDNFIIPEDAFVEMTNFYNFRGRILTRQGYTLLGRLRRELEDESLGNTGASPWSFNVFTLLGLAANEPNANIALNDPNLPFEIDLDTGTEIFTEPSPADGTLTSSVSGPGAGTINYATGDITLTHTVGAGQPALITMAYYPGLPVMGLRVYELPAINSEDLIGFDTIYAYRFSNALNTWQEWIPGTIWSGSNSNFFWTYNYWQSAANNSLLWTTNFSGTGGDVTRYADSLTWTNFTPLINATDNVWQCLAIVAYKDRLLFLNTYEGTTGLGLAGSTNFPQRCRFSQNGDPLNAAAWREDQPGRGGYIDAPTNEIITSVSFIRDILIVHFERSSWQLRYTGNEILPFVFERINSELGVESTFSTVQFDQGIFGVGNYSINSCNGNSVERIDLQIPDEVFEFHNDNDGPKRIYGIRDYFNEFVYWTFPNDDENGTYPNRILVYNYRNPAYSVFRDSFTCFGYYQRTNDLRWQDIEQAWEQLSNIDDIWGGAWQQSGFPIICAGNQQGFTFLLDQQSANAESLHIQAITSGTTTIINSPSHNLSINDVIEIQGILGTSDVLNGERFIVQTIVDADNFTIDTPTLGAGLTYLGGGTLSRVNRPRLASKRFNFLEGGQRKKIGYLDFLLDATEEGECTLELYIDQNNSTAVNNTADGFFNQIVPTFIEPEQTAAQDMSWHRAFCFVEGQFLQFVVTLNNDQMLNSAITSSPINIHASIIWQQPGGRLI